MYGTQTMKVIGIQIVMFENDVKMYGTQTLHFVSVSQIKFENDVKMYGTQTDLVEDLVVIGLRMM